MLFVSLLILAIDVAHIAGFFILQYPFGFGTVPLALCRHRFDMQRRRRIGFLTAKVPGALVLGTAIPKIVKPAIG
ncbi:hypothetical protein QNH14_23355 (plasmid) [Apirhabdus apintestini]|nr:hypothetical protein QNH14_23355 [Enterobacteriaceae bacterium CA-0114]